jgi:hypothetical protein
LLFSPVFGIWFLLVRISAFEISFPSSFGIWVLFFGISTIEYPPFLK